MNAPLGWSRNSRAAAEPDGGDWRRIQIGAASYSYAATAPFDPDRGSIVLECAIAGDAPDPVVLLRLIGAEGATEEASIAIGPDGRLTLSIASGEALALDVSEQIAAARGLLVTWSWDRAQGQTVLTAESRRRGRLRQRVGPARIAPSLACAQALALGRAAMILAPDCAWVAFADCVRPVGPGACFAPATPILTPSGPRRADEIRAGDLVETVDSGPQPVLWSGVARLPSIGGFRPVRLAPPGFGESVDLWLTASERIAVGGPAVEYLFGEEAALIEARDLIDGRSAMWSAAARPPALLNWRGLLLPGHELLIADGCPIESIGLGGLARAPEMALTTPFADLVREGGLPIHASPPRRVLRPFEIAALKAMRSRANGPVDA